MSQVYITEATFKQLTTKVELPQDFQFKDTLIWVLSNGSEIGLDNPVIFSDAEIIDLLTFKAICKDSNLLNITVFKEIKVRDSYRYDTLHQKRILVTTLIKIVKNYMQIMIGHLLRYQKFIKNAIQTKRS